MKITIKLDIKGRAGNIYIAEDEDGMMITSIYAKNHTLGKYHLTEKSAYIYNERYGRNNWEIIDQIPD